MVTAIILAGRVGSAFAAELGTMQVSEQTDTLRVLGSDPVDYLISPRVLACMVAMPILNILCFATGMAASTFLAEVVYSVNANIILDSAARATTLWDVVSSQVSGCPSGTRAKSGRTQVAWLTLAIAYASADQVCHLWRRDRCHLVRVGLHNLGWGQGRRRGHHQVRMRPSLTSEQAQAPLRNVSQGGSSSADASRTRSHQLALARPRSAVVISLVCIFVADFFLSYLFFQGQGDALKQCM